MTYQEATDYLFTATPVFQNTGATAYKEGLENILALDEYFGEPHRAYRTIHVGGTNGKGSTSHTLAAILQAAGYKVGLFTSPHLLDFRERIRVNGEPIAQERVCQFVEAVGEVVERVRPSFFELTTMLAFLYFKEQAVDFAIIEVGLGGRLDSTNIIKPILSIITNISLDHTQFLGKDLPSIAREKAGIIKPNTAVVIGESLRETAKVFDAVAKEQNAPLHYAHRDQELSFKGIQGGLRQYQSKDFGLIEGGLLGSAQYHNTKTVLSAVAELQKLGIHLEDSAVRKGFAEVTSLTGLQGRWQVLQTSPYSIVLDTAHNEAGLREVFGQLKAQDCQTLRIVLGFAKDKEAKKIVQLFPEKAHYYLTQINSERALPREELATMVKARGLNYKPLPSVAEAIEKAQQDALEGDFIFIGGSNFVIAEALAYFQNLES